MAPPPPVACFLELVVVLNPKNLQTLKLWEKTELNITMFATGAIIGKRSSKSRNQFVQNSSPEQETRDKSAGKCESNKLQTKWQLPNVGTDGEEEFHLFNHKIKWGFFFCSFFFNDLY
jgi:hypothetical protein